MCLKVAISNLLKKLHCDFYFVLVLGGHNNFQLSLPVEQVSAHSCPAAQNWWVPRITWSTWHCLGTIRDVVIVLKEPCDVGDQAMKLGSKTLYKAYVLTPMLSQFLILGKSLLKNKYMYIYILIYKCYIMYISDIKYI